VNTPVQTATPPSLRQPFEYLEEIVNILKTAFPLLALTMETFVDQIHTRFKATPDEDAYRFTSILLTEAITVRLVKSLKLFLILEQAYTQRVNSNIEDGSIPIQCATNAARFSANVAGLVR
jgi:transformation/transcription domain-associated protein